MVAPDTADLTKLLRQAGRGDQAAVDHAIPLIYQELRRLAGSYLRNQPFNNSLQPTALVHEAYLRLVDDRKRTGAIRRTSFTSRRPS